MKKSTNNAVLDTAVEKTTENAANAVAVIENRENGLSTIDLNGGPLPDLESADVYPFDLMSDYWTPEKSMESKRVFFDKIMTRTVLDDKTQEQIELECAFFIEKTKDGSSRTISNGSKRLVGAIESSNILRGTPLLITYLGKKKNSTNTKMSDNWSVKPLMIKIS